MNQNCHKVDNVIYVHPLCALLEYVFHQLNRIKILLTIRFMQKILKVILILKSIYDFPDRCSRLIWPEIPLKKKKKTFTECLQIFPKRQKYEFGYFWFKSIYIFQKLNDLNTRWTRNVKNQSSYSFYSFRFINIQSNERPL